MPFKVQDKKFGGRCRTGLHFCGEKDIGKKEEKRWGSGRQNYHFTLNIIITKGLIGSGW